MSRNSAVLSSADIFNEYNNGNIIISPYKKEHINNSSYDVTLGEWFWRFTPPKTNVYNMYDERIVRSSWELMAALELKKHPELFTTEDHKIATYKEDDKLIFLKPRETILAHTNEFIGGKNFITTMMKARSSLGRNFIEVCRCFGGETKFLTDNGLMRLDEHVGESVNVLTKDGFKPAIVREFGEQSLQTIEIMPVWLIPKGRKYQGPYWKGNKRAIRKVRATKDHGWELVNDSVTRNLVVGDIIKANGYTPDILSTDYKLGVQHGFVFGDGIRSSKNSFVVHFYGRKYEQMKPYFDNVKPWDLKKGSAKKYIASTTVTSERNLKETPKDYSPDYIAGFIHGWLCADGNVGKKDDDIVLQSISDEALDFVEDLCAYAGYIVTGKGEKKNEITNKGVRSKKVKWLTLQQISSLTAWKVVSINPVEKKEVVYCVTVPNFERFTLAGGIYSLNCAGWGDVGYVNRWTMEITNNSDCVIPLVVGRRVAQIVFFYTGDLLENVNYVAQSDSKYASSDLIKELKSTWTPEDMLPKMWKDREVR